MLINLKVKVSHTRIVPAWTSFGLTRSASEAKETKLSDDKWAAGTE